MNLRYRLLNWICDRQEPFNFAEANRDVDEILAIIREQITGRDAVDAATREIKAVQHKVGTTFDEDVKSILAAALDAITGTGAQE
jgi:uncharacterized Zn finger protein